MSLMRKCEECGGSGTQELLYEIKNTEPFGYQSNLLSRPVTCKFCNEGYTITDEGQEMLLFLNKFYPTAHQHTELMRF